MTEVTISKLLSIVTVIGYAVAIILSEGITIELFKFCFVLLLPLALIWFPEEFGRFTGHIGSRTNIDTETPPILISILGWFFLLGIPAVLYFSGN